MFIIQWLIVTFCSTHLFFSENLLSLKETFARSDKLNIGAVFQYTVTKSGKAPWPPNTTPQTVAVCCTSSVQLWDRSKECLVEYGILTSQDCFSTFWVFGIKKTTKVHILTDCWPLILISHPRERERVCVWVEVCACLCMIVLHSATIQRGRKICNAKRGSFMHDV